MSGYSLRWGTLPLLALCLWCVTPSGCEGPAEGRALTARDSPPRPRPPRAPGPGEGRAGHSPRGAHRAPVTLPPPEGTPGPAPAPGTSGGPAGSRSGGASQRNRADWTRNPRDRPTVAVRPRFRASPSRARSRLPARRLIGPNVCGRRCCSGWTLNPGTNRCMKPVCAPPCQNRGSCSRPQVCVCRSGFQGSRCEEVVPEQHYISHRRAISSRLFSSSLSGSYLNMVHRIEKRTKNNTKSIGETSSTTRHKTSTGDESQGSETQSRSRQQTNSQQLLGTSRTVKHVSNRNGLLLSNALPNANTQTQSNNRFTANGQRSTNYHNAQARGANLTTSVERIKIVFTPTICKRNCKNGKCYNNCKKGNPTTLYSENGYGPVSKSGFRIYFCQIPCLNGGHCIGRDTCWCPSNSTGKFCHLPVPPEKRTVTKPAPVNSASQSVYTLPLSNQQVVMLPSLVNIHVNHPPEASVQIHQVARVKNAPHSSDQNSIESSQDQESVRSVQQRSQPNDAGKENGQTRQQLQPTVSSVGRCFQETVDGQCGKPLPGLTKQDDCCGSVGMSWGYHKCTQCPPKPAYPKIENGQLECPLGYKNRNQTHCQDINECLIPGICQHANCLNTRGSYRCTCKAGYMMDTSRKHCISDKAVSAERGFCFRSLSRGNCSLPLTQQIPKQICCCSRVGKGWGRNCEKCPLPGSVVFNEICPAGHGYHYSRSDVQISLRPAEDQDLVRISSQQHFNNYEDDTFTKPLHPSVPVRNPSVDTYPVEVVVKTSPPTPVHLIPESEAENAAAVFAEEISVTDICDISPNICGPGHCISREGSYTCSCDPGYHLDSQHTKCVDYDECRQIPQPCNYGKCENTAGDYRCICSAGFIPNQQSTDCLDIDECEQDPCEGKGRCINMVGTHSCACFSGYTLVILQEKQTCQDINECEQPTLCRRGRCTNTPGSYRCDCDQGYIMTRQGQCDDIDECRNPTACPTGRCINTLGSFECVSCPTGYKAQNGRCLDENECLTAGVCENGKCINLDGSYRCICNQGFKRMADNKSCRDIDECASLNVCPNALCTNTEGSYICTSCPPGYGVSEGRCEDIDECASPNVCPNGVCSNTDGSYTCLPCGPGYRVSEDRRRCEDVNECLTEDICGSNRECMNTDGSYFCICAKGYTTIPGGTGCQDINECLTSDICGPNGECINNEDGSYYCLCAQGYITTPNGTGCQDWDECTEDARCAGGQCLNTDGSYMCKCETGFTHLPETEDCVDIDECSVYGSSVCGMWKCENTIGSYQCIMECQPGFQHTFTGECTDINECMNETICSVHEYCENTVGSFRCVCDRGFQKPPGEQRCVDINECEMMNRVCGAALCENFEGSFFCVCRDENEEFDPFTSQCLTPSRPYQTREETGTVISINPDIPMRTVPVNRDRKDCYYNLNDANFCDNVLAQNITKEECCCTVGAGWGDNCEVHPCPVIDTDEYEEICPDGKGIIPFRNYEDADECAMFGSEICKNGRCVNTVRHYACYCHTGFHYDTVRLECIDNDECQDENTCVNGECVNTPGSFNCFCSPPLILDITRKKCINGTGLAVDLFEERNVHQGICWQEVGERFICNRPLMSRQTTYTECCCLYGEAWGLECAFCPSRTSDDFAQLCNIPRSPGDGSTGLRERPGYEYSPEGPEGPQYGQEIQQGAGTYYNYLQPEYGPYDAQRGPEYELGDPYLGAGYGIQNPRPDSGYGSREVHTDPQYELREPQPGLAYEPRETQPRPAYDPRGFSRVAQYRPRETESIVAFSSSDINRYDSFEGLQAEECGILNGCENGRCVRVREGYTCDCFDGYKFDVAKMACVDINECEDVSDTIPLCRNAKCENTEGSYNCNCLPGYVLSQDLNDCKLKTEAEPQ